MATIFMVFALIIQHGTCISTQYAFFHGSGLLVSSHPKDHHFELVLQVRKGQMKRSYQAANNQTISCLIKIQCLVKILSLRPMLHYLKLELLLFVTVDFYIYLLTFLINLNR